MNEPEFIIKGKVLPEIPKVELPSASFVPIHLYHLAQEGAIELVFMDEETLEVELEALHEC